MIDYVHANPVRKGLVVRPADWKWSSAGWCELRSPGFLGPSIRFLGSGRDERGTVSARLEAAVRARLGASLRCDPSHPAVSFRKIKCNGEF
jgi:hypothetical protein